ncbi:MAG: IS1595 family transposase [Actinobacteria bacterium]|nr:IS1595 family transposase [Actinomycetota bacterium]
MRREKLKPDYKDMSWMIFQQEFKKEDDCYKWLFKTRWPNGFICPKCEGEKFWWISTQKLYKCANCNYRVSITAGTIFHKTRTSLMKWFMLIYRMSTSKTGVSINEMKRELEIKDYKTVWTMAHKIRKAMADRDAKYNLAGLVETDESFFGTSKPGNRGRGAEGKRIVLIAISIWKDKSGKERPGFAKAFIIKDASAETIKEVLIRTGVADNEIELLIKKIRTDGWRSYETVSNDLNIGHYRVILKDPKDTIKLLPWTHRLIGNAKAVFSGPHRGISPKHLQRYLSEVCYRFNRRFWGREAFHRLLFACSTTNTITRDELMEKYKVS